MSTVQAEATTIADLLEQLGDIPPHRVRLRPTPGTATERDVLDVHAREKRLCELIDGTLVEKVMGYSESVLAIAVAHYLRAFVKPRNLGLIAGESGMLRLTVGLVRIPDVSFVSWGRIPGGKVPKEPIPHLAPDLAVEVLSKSNTEREMQRKLHDFFEHGVLLVWLIDPVTRTVEVYTNPNDCILLHTDDTLDGGAVLPGFALPLRDLFSELDQVAGGT